MAYVLSLDGGGHSHDKPKKDLLRMDCFFLLGLPGTLRPIKNSDN